MAARFPHLATLNPRSDGPSISQGWTVLITERDGFIDGRGGHGLFIQQTRLLSHYCYRINSQAPFPVAISNVDQHSSLAYYVAPPPSNESNPSKKAPTEQVIELRLSRAAGEGFHEDVHLTNYSGAPIDVPLEIEVDADFADFQETRGKREQQGKRTQQWKQAGPQVWELIFDYRAEHSYDHQGETGTARIHRGLTIRIERASSPPEFHKGILKFRVQLQPRESWRACLSFIAFIDGQTLPLLYSCNTFGDTGNEYDRKRADFMERSTSFRFPGSGTLTAVVAGTLEQSRRDLASLRLYPLDRADDKAWTVAAGLPNYPALFGRDPLVAAWQAGPLTADLLRGILEILPASQGTAVNDWRDEQPGRMIHQMQQSPLSALNYNPLARYYGTMSSPIFYAEVLFALYLWTGNKEQVSRFVRPALRAMQWLDRYGDLDGDGFYEYQTHSDKGVRNQGWKDSDDAMVHADGSRVETPIASAEVQACAYIAKRHLAQVLRWLGYRDEPDILGRQAHELKQRFNDTFWMPDEEYLPMGLDSHKRMIRSIGSDAGACLAANIVDPSRVRKLADRLMADDLFTGWGIRTLSSGHPAFNPFSYHRGTVWPVENGIIALAFLRYGLHEHLHRLCRGLFEAAALFDLYRLPEVFGGQQRDADHPFPALYPDACWPQAWSASAVFSLVQAMLGIFPFAPLHTLVVDPCLPDWLPEITLENLHLGEAACTIRFDRKANGSSSFKVLATRGRIHIVRQPSPWSLTAGWGERIEDALLSLVPAR